MLPQIESRILKSNDGGVVLLLRNFWAWFAERDLGNAVAQHVVLVEEGGLNSTRLSSQSGLIRDGRKLLEPSVPAAEFG